MSEEDISEQDITDPNKRKRYEDLNKHQELSEEEDEWGLSKAPVKQIDYVAIMKKQQREDALIAARQAEDDENFVQEVPLDYQEGRDYAQTQRERKAQNQGQYVQPLDLKRKPHVPQIGFKKQFQEKFQQRFEFAEQPFHGIGFEAPSKQKYQPELVQEQRQLGRSWTYHHNLPVEKEYYDYEPNLGKMTYAEYAPVPKTYRDYGTAPRIEDLRGKYRQRETQTSYNQPEFGYSRAYQEFAPVKRQLSQQYKHANYRWTRNKYGQWKRKRVYYE